MSIKFIDQLEPNGPFALVKSESVGYSTAYIDETGTLTQITNTKDALDVLYGRVMAEPVLKYFQTDDDESEPGLQTIAVEYGASMGLPVYVQTPSLGNWTFTVYRRLHGSGDEYKFYKVFPLPKGTTYIPLGACTEYADYDYKLEIVDGAGKTAYTPWFEDGSTTVKKASLEYRIYCSSLSYTLSPTNSQLEEIYTLDNFDLTNVAISYKAGMSGYGKLFYKLYAPGASLPSALSLDDLSNCASITLNSGELINVNKLVRTEVTFNIPKGSDAGTSTLVSCFVVSSSAEAFVEGETFISALQTMSLDRLAANATSVSTLTSFAQDVSTSDSSVLDLLLKTTLANLKYTDTVKLTGKVYYECSENADCYYSQLSNKINNVRENQTDIALKCMTNKTWEKICTPNRGSVRWNIARISFPEDIADTTQTQLNCFLSVEATSVSTLPTDIVPAPTFFNYVTRFRLNKQEGTSGYVTENLLFNFNTLDSNSNYNATDSNITGTTIAAQACYINGAANNIGLKLYGTTQGASGIVEGTEGSDTAPRLRLTRGSYAMLYKRGSGTVPQPFSPWSILASANTTQKRFTLEAYLKVSDLGDVSNRALTLINDKSRTSSDGISISANDMYANLQGYPNKAYLRPDVWQHVVVVVDSQEATANAKELNPYPTLRIYIDGVLSKISRFDANASSLLSNISSMPPLVLNGAVNTTQTVDYNSSSTSIDSLPISGDGDCEFKVIRIYDTALSASEVFQNFLDTREGKEVIDAVTERNGDGLTKIYFVANNTLSSQDASNYVANSDQYEESLVDRAKQDLARWADYNAPKKATKKLNPTTFEKLNQLTVKDTIENENGQVVHGSKTSLVNCSVFVKKDGAVTLYHDDVDVYLQGTSSLAYPVKNYQIKINQLVLDQITQTYSRSKLADLPPLQDASTGWYTPSSVYTLKCDFMEHSHRNNTPTACYYQDTVLDGVIKALHGNQSNCLDYYSPARSIVTQATVGDDLKDIKPYRDAIDGFPCVVYFTDEFRDPSNESDDSAYTYAGTYMFNVDKVGDQLGFDLSAEEINAEKSGFTAADKALASTEGEIACVSYEGAANDDESAAAFLPFRIKYASQISEFISALKSGTLKLSDHFKIADEKVTFVYTSGGKEKTEDILHNGFNPESYRAQNGKLFYNDAEIDDEDIIKQLENGELILLFYNTTDNIWEDPRSIYNYIEETLEPRETTYEDEEVSSIYSPMINAIDWLYANKDNRNIFRSDFSKYFSYEYCMAYYLQMLLFAQVDNAGKNAMFDVWGNNLSPSANSKFGKLYPRPYDMDTQMGLNNSGADVIEAFAELNPKLSPVSCTGTKIGLNSQSYINNWLAITGNDSHARYKTYNTSESNLWKTFGLYFQEEIAQVYEYLRNTGIYSVDQICQAINAKTCDKIGESYYNFDVSSKYLSYKATNEAIAKDKAEGELSQEELDKIENKDAVVYYEKYLFCTSGNRKNRYRTFLDQRIAFLDSFFGYKTNQNNLELRVGYVKEDEDLWQEINGTKFVGLGIQVSKPQYVRFQVGSTEALYTALVLPDETHDFGNEKDIPGALFWIPVTSDAGDKEVIITGADCITTFHHLQNLVPTKCLLTSCHNLTNLDLSNCTRLHTLQLSSAAKKLQKIDVTNTYALSSVQGTALNLSGCENLVELIATNSSVDAIELPSQSSLKHLALTNAKKLTSLTISNNSLLTNKELDLSGCSALTNFSLINCSGIKISDATGFTLENLLAVANLEYLKLEDCDQITVLDLTKAINLATLILKLPELTSLNLAGLSSTIFKYEAGTTELGLNLTNLPKLATLNLKEAGLPNDGTESVFGAVVLPVDQLRTLNLQLSLLNSICASGNTPSFGVYNFDKLNLTSLNITNNKVVKQIQNLGYTVTTTSFFNSCTNLTEITRTDDSYVLTVNSGKASSLFTGCSNLKAFPIGWLVFEDKIGSAGSMFYNCPKISSDCLQNTAQQLCQKGVTSFGTFAYNCDQLTEIPDTFFTGDTSSNITSVINVSECFSACSSLKTVGNAFSKFVNLENISGLFMSCTALADVSKDIFAGLPNINQVELAFYNCKKLGTSGLLSSSTTSSKVFHKNCNIANIEGLFYNCESINPKDELEAFFQNLSSISNAKLAFYGCKKLKALPNKILANNGSLTHIDGLFANSFTSDNSDFEITTDFNLFDSENPPTGLVSAKGVFAGCTKIHGKVGNKFFETFANVTDLGSGAVAFTKTHSVGATTVQGFFTNTGIEAIHEDCLRKAINVTSCDKFLCKISNGNVIANETFKGFFNDSDEANYSDVVPANFFLKYATTANEALPITKLSYMFAGCSCLAEIDADCSLPDSIENTQGMFYNCSQLVSIPKTFLRDKANLQNVSYMFAGCTALCSVDLASEESIFKGCTNLANCKGMFMKSGLTDMQDHYESGTAVINSSLFEDCRSSLKNTSYMFADCTNLGGAIGTGYAQINNEEPLKARYVEYKRQVATGLINSLNATLKATRETALKNLANVSFNNESEFSDYMQQAQMNAVLSALESNGFSFSSFNDIADTGILSESIASHTFKLNSEPETEEAAHEYPEYSVLSYNKDTWNASFGTNILHCFDTYCTKPESKVVEIKKYGLLANCPKLAEVEGMFLNCDHLIGPIPADMFYGETTSNISSLAYLFCGCTRLATVPSESSSRQFSESCTAQLANENARYSDHNVAGNYQEVYPHLIYDYDDYGNYTNIKLLQDNTTDQAFSDMRAEYFVPKDWLAKLRNVTNISHIFSQVGSFDILTHTSGAPSDFINYASKGESLEGVPLMLKIPNELFSINSNNFRIINAAYAFFGNASIGKSALSADFLGKSVPYYLQDIQYIFALSNLPQVKANGTCFLANKNTNTTLKTVTYAFAYANRVPYGSAKTTTAGTPFINDSYAHLSPYNRNYSGIQGEAVDFTIGFNITDKQGAFVNQQNVSPYTNTDAKYTIYKTVLYNSEASISHARKGKNAADTAVTTAFNLGAAI